MDTQPNAQATHRVEWEEVARLADDAFDVWSGQPELLWAKQAWEVLAKAGLTAYRNKVEHHHVLFRLLALSGIYSDFCDVAFDETSEIEYSYFFELDKFVGGQLWARVPGWRFTEEEMEDSASSTPWWSTTGERSPMRW